MRQASHPRPLIDSLQWERMSAAQLAELVSQLEPTGALAAAVRYEGQDLVPAGLLSAEDLGAEYVPPAEVFKAGMGFRNKGMWEELAAKNTEVLTWVRFGYSEFVKGYATMPRIDRDNNSNTNDHVECVTQEVTTLVEVGAVRDVTGYMYDNDVVRVIAPLTVAVQASGKRRLCWNGRPINKYLPDKHFKMEHAEKAARMMRAGDWMFTLDMKSGYHQVPCKPAFMKFLCFRWQGRVYQWQVMPFGLSTAPRAYSKLTRRLLERWRAKGVRCSNYIDDFIFFAPTFEKALEIRAMVLRDLSELGWFISVGKSMLQPGTMVTYLGLVFCSVPEPHVRVPVEKVARVKSSLAGILRRECVGCAVQVHGTTLASLLGFLQSLKLAVPLVPVFTRELYACLATLPRSEEGWFEYGHMVTLSEAALAECRLWDACIDRWNGFMVAPTHVSRVLYTDGCSGGFGALVHRVLERHVEPAVVTMAGSWEHSMSTDSVMTELVGLWRALVGAGSELVGQTVLHRTDSISTYAVLAKGGSQRSRRLTDVVRRIVTYCMLFNVNLASQYVGAGVIIKSGADMLSRDSDWSDCKLNPLVFERVWRLWGPFAVDMFASGASVQCVPSTGDPLPYWSLLADGKAKGIDAMSAQWEGEAAGGVVYAFPPVALVGETIQLILQAGVRAVVVMPRWQAQWWWPLVLDHARMQPVLLSTLHVPSVEGPLLVEGRRGGPVHPFGPSFQCPESVEWVAVLF